MKIHNFDVAILGSINLDNVFRCQFFPKPGETIISKEFYSGPGGKGLNQAVAAVRNSVSTIMLGAIGSDANGTYLLNFLKDENINTSGVVIDENKSTGIAHIIIDDNAENSIIVASGANETIFEVTAAIQFTKIIIAQLETPIEVIKTAFKMAQESGLVRILNCAPVNHKAIEIFDLCDILILNQHELSSFSGIIPVYNDNKVENYEEIVQAARKILINEEQTIVVTLGGDGVLVVDKQNYKFIKARQVKPIDTAGAGDCFCGTLAAQIAKGHDVITAAKIANVAASIQVTRKGAAVAMPNQEEIDAACG